MKDKKVKIGDYKVLTAIEVAEEWAKWCGNNSEWVWVMIAFGDVGGLVRWWGGYPQSASAIPLCFELFEPDGTPINDVSKSGSRLIDIKNAADYLYDKAAGS